MAEAILRFQQYDKRFEWYLPENIPEDKQEEMFHSWLDDIYNNSLLLIHMEKNLSLTR